MRINKEIVYAGAEPPLGGLWQQVCEAENALAEMLEPLPEGTAVLGDHEVWLLVPGDEGLELSHANWDGETLSDLTSRFDFGLAFVDVEESDLEDSIRRTEIAMETFQTINVKAELNRLLGDLTALGVR